MFRVQTAFLDEITIDFWRSRQQLHDSDLPKAKRHNRINKLTKVHKSCFSHGFLLVMDLDGPLISAFFYTSIRRKLSQSVSCCIVVNAVSIIRHHWYTNVITSGIPRTTQHSTTEPNKGMTGTYVSRINSICVVQTCSYVFFLRLITCYLDRLVSRQTYLNRNVVERSHYDLLYLNNWTKVKIL